MKELTGITITNFGNTVYFVIFLIFLFVLIFRFLKINKIIKILSPIKNENIILNFSKSKNTIKLSLLIIGSFFLFFSLLSPAWDKKEESVQQEGRDIFIALDISRSMLAKDFPPNRLEWSKQKIKNLLKLLKSDRAGLILFSGSAFVQCPLTRDFSTFYMLLDQADTEIISSGTTSIDKAIQLAIEKFKSSENQKSKLLIIFTDGEDFSSNLSGTKKDASKLGLNIFTVGVGTSQGAPIPLFDNFGHQIGSQLDSKGSIVNSCLNEGILKALSENCGGFYVHGTNKDDDIKEIEKGVSQFEKEAFENKKISYLEQQYPYFLVVSFLCFAIEWIL